jgi:hypothetical protein
MGSAVDRSAKEIDMGALAPLTEQHRGAVRDLQRVATHVLARRRFAVAGRFGLRPSPGGIATPAFGDDESLRISGMYLVRERRLDGAMTSTASAIDGTSLADLAELGGVDLATELSVGHDTPPVGDPDSPIRVTADAVATIASWFSLAAVALDAVLVGAPMRAPSSVQLWPEHFDLAVDVGTASGRVNLGASPGDDVCEEPYVYVGPWGPQRPGDDEYWNVGFGALVRYEVVRASPDPAAAVVAFWQRGLVLLDGEGS